VLRRDIVIRRDGQDRVGFGSAGVCWPPETGEVEPVAIVEGSRPDEFQTEQAPSAALDRRGELMVARSASPAYVRYCRVAFIVPSHIVAREVARYSPVKSLSWMRPIEVETTRGPSAPCAVKLPSDCTTPVPRIPFERFSETIVVPVTVNLIS